VDCTKLSGVVQLGISYKGSIKADKYDRDDPGKSIIVGVVEIRNDLANRVILKVIADEKTSTIMNFVKDNVEVGSTIMTDNLQRYSGVSKNGYDHIVDLELTHLQQAFSNMKTLLKETYHGAVRSKHLQSYLNEYTFRFNNRGTPMSAFKTILGLTGQYVGPTRKGLYGVKKGKKEQKHPAPLKENFS
jgi:transposase-like protein